MTMPFFDLRWRWFFSLIGGLLVAMDCAAGLPETIQRVKPSIVVVGTYNKLRSPPFVMRGTGFAVGDGSLIATNAHVLPSLEKLDAAEKLAVLISGESSKLFQEVQLLSKDVEHDLAILRMQGHRLPALVFQAAENTREGQEIAFMGFPIGGALGFSPVTHRGIVSSITPIVLPGGNAHELKETSIRRLRQGAFPILQLDATAYPGNSGGPVFEPDTGLVLGVVNMVFIKETKESVLEKPSGISYAIPVSYLQALVTRIRLE